MPPWRTCATATPARPASWRASTSTWPAGAARRTPWRARCAPSPRSTPARTGSSTCCAPAPCWPGPRPERLSAQIDTDLAGLLLLTHTPDAAERALALLRVGRGPRGPAGAVAAAGPGTPPARPAGRAAAQGADRGDGRADRLRAPGRPDGRRRAHQPADRQRAGGDGQGRRVAPLARLPQARHLARATNLVARRSAPRSERVPRLSAMPEGLQHTVRRMVGRDPHESRPGRHAAGAALRPDLRHRLRRRRRPAGPRARRGPRRRRASSASASRRSRSPGRGSTSPGSRRRTTPTTGSSGSPRWCRWSACSCWPSGCRRCSSR